MLGVRWIVMVLAAGMTSTALASDQVFVDVDYDVFDRGVRAVFPDPADPESEYEIFAVEETENGRRGRRWFLLHLQPETSTFLASGAFPAPRDLHSRRGAVSFTIDGYRLLCTDESPSYIHGRSRESTDDHFHYANTEEFIDREVDDYKFQVGMYCELDVIAPGGAVTFVGGIGEFFKGRSKIFIDYPPSFESRAIDRRDAEALPVRD